MQEIIRLIRIGFENMENRDGEYRKLVGTFIGENGYSPHGKVAEYIKNLPPEKMYLGWNGKVYPQYIIEREYAQ